MATRLSRYRDSAHSLRGASTRARPVALRWLSACAVISVLFLVALPLRMAVDRDATLATVLRARPDLTSSGADYAVGAVIIYAAVLHALDVVLVVWFTAKVWAGRRWARIALTAYLIFVLGFSLLSAGAGTEYLVVVVLSNIVHLLMLGLLWLPPSVRGFFAGHRRTGPEQATDAASASGRAG